MPQIFIKTSPSSSSPGQGYDTPDRDEFISMNGPWIFWYYFPEEEDWHRGPAFKIAEEAQQLADQAAPSDPDDEDRW